MPFDRGQCQIPYPSPGPKGWGFQLTGALYLYLVRFRLVLLWLCTVCINLQLQNIARERDERKGASSDLISPTSQFLFIDESS